MTGVCKAGVQSPEHLGYTHGCLRNGLGDVAARRGYCADGGEGAFSLVGAHALDNAGALIELGDAAGQIGGVAFLTGHFLQSSAHLSKGLCPAGGGVGYNCYVVAHVSEILGYGDAGVDTCLSGCNGHIRGVGYENSSLHQGLAGMGVNEFGELHQNVCHLVAALAAADVDHYIHVGPLCKGVLHNGFTAAEGAGDCGGAALGHGEHGIHYSLAALQGLIRNELSCVGSVHSHGPALHHAEGDLIALCFKNAYGFLYGEGAFLHALYGAALTDGHQYLMEYGAGFLNGTYYVTGDHFVTGLYCGYKVPLLFSVKGGDGYAAGDGMARQLSYLRQGALDAVVDAFQHTGAKLHAQRHAGGHDLCAGAEACGLFIDLDTGAVAGHIQYFADQVLGAYAHNVAYVGVGQAFRHYKRARYLDYFSAHFRSSSLA